MQIAGIEEGLGGEAAAKGEDRIRLPANPGHQAGAGAIVGIDTEGQAAEIEAGGLVTAIGVRIITQQRPQPRLARRKTGPGPAIAEPAQLGLRERPLGRIEPAPAKRGKPHRRRGEGELQRGMGRRLGPKRSGGTGQQGADRGRRCEKRAPDTTGAHMFSEPHPCQLSAPR